MAILKYMAEHPRGSVQIEKGVMEIPASNLDVFATTIIYLLVSYNDWVNYLTFKGKIVLHLPLVIVFTCY